MQIALPSWFWEFPKPVRDTIKRLTQTSFLNETVAEHVNAKDCEDYRVSVHNFVGSDYEEYVGIRISNVPLRLYTSKTIRRSLLLDNK